MIESLCIVPLPDRKDATPAYSTLQRRFGGHSLLEWILRRVADAQQIDKIVVIVSAADSNSDEVQHLPPDIPVFTNEEPDTLGRVRAALHEFPARAVVQVGVDSPFIDPVLIDRLVVAAETHPSCDYISYCFGDGRPVIRSRIGVFAEWCRADAIFHADREAIDPTDRHHVTSYIRAHPETFYLRLIPVPPALDRDDLRLTVDVEEDWDHVREIYDALGPESLDWQKIAGLLDQQPGMLRRMARLNRREAHS